MMRRISLVVAVTIIAASPIAAQELPKFMVGCWADGAINESWRVTGDSMTGVGEMVRGTTRRVSERMSIGIAEGKLAYTAQPTGAVSATSFKASHVSADSAVFENPAHDFPQRLVYFARGRDSLMAIVTGVESGTSQVLELAFGRQPCRSGP
jgi:hypothetical protein